EESTPNITPAMKLLCTNADFASIALSFLLSAHLRRNEAPVPSPCHRGKRTRHARDAPQGEDRGRSPSDKSAASGPPNELEGDRRDARPWQKIAWCGGCSGEAGLVASWSVDRIRVVGELPEEPRAGITPLALDGALRHAHHLGGLLDGEPAEEAELD